jgi:transcriptional regulator with XRE-family HTH domain
MKHGIAHLRVAVVLKNIQAVRRQKGYSQEYVALKMGISQKTYSKIENGIIVLTVRYILLIAAILEVDIVTLIGNECVARPHLVVI